MTTYNAFTKEWQEGAASNARALGAVQLNHLVFLLCYEEAYNRVLPALCERFGVFSEDSNKIPHRHDFNPSETQVQYHARVICEMKAVIKGEIPDSWPGKGISLGTPQHRSVIWYYLLARMAETTEERRVFFQGVSPQKTPTFPLYRDLDGGFQEVKLGDERTFAHFVKLEELASYFKSISDNFDLNLPLPLLLFPSSVGNKPADATFEPSSPLKEQEGLQSRKGERAHGVKGEDGKGFLHSGDYHSVSKNGLHFSLTNYQAAVIGALHEAHTNGTPDLSQDHILEAIGSTGKRLIDIFKRNKEAWDVLVKPGAKKGAFRLNI